MNATEADNWSPKERIMVNKLKDKQRIKEEEISESSNPEKLNKGYTRNASKADNWSPKEHSVVDRLKDEQRI